jgi:hypothetical protein
MNKFIILSIALLISACITVFLLVDSMVKNTEKLKSKYKSEIGKKIVIDNDTVTIVNYSIITESFTLSNNKTIDCSFIIRNDSLNLK